MTDITTANTTTDTRSVVIERIMPHPPEKVWRALTQTPLLEEWLQATASSFVPHQDPAGMEASIARS
jgi:uncharacterized protein YndB with AHSA1/START domain